MATVTTCGVCGEKAAREVVSHRKVHFLGHEQSYVRREYACKRCKETFTNDEQGEANERAERVAVAAALRNVGGAELRALRELVGATQAQLENALGLGRNTLARWETEQRDVPPYIKTIVRLLALNPSAVVLLQDQDLPAEERIDPGIEGSLQPTRRYQDRSHLKAVPSSDASHLGSKALRDLMRAPAPNFKKRWSPRSIGGGEPLFQAVGT